MLFGALSAVARRPHGTVAVGVALLLAVAPAAGAKPRGRDACGSCASSASPAATAPADTSAAGASQDAYADPSSALGAVSPSCRFTLGAQARRSCRVSGSVAQPHPLSSYGLDVRVGFSLTDPGKSFLGALQSVAAALWMALLYVVKGVLLVLEWAFSLDLTNSAMPRVRQTLERLHEQAFGDWWLLLAVSLTGLWGIWRGLVQRRATETLTGLAATVGLIVVALVLIAEPAQTIGEAAKVTNQAGSAVLAAATGARADDPRAGLTGALQQVFATTVRDPWCALEFGSVAYCDQRTGDPARPTNAEVWLAYPAQSWQRDRLHSLMEGDTGGGGLLSTAGSLLGIGDHRQLPDDVKRLVRKAPTRARMQDAGGTFPRLALLAIVTVGLSGALVVYGYLGVRLLLAAGLTLVLLLIAPGMLLAPALGDAGRATFVAWIKRLIGAVAAKLVFAVFLAVVLAASRAFTAVGAGWFGTWLLLAAFWWGIFLKRDELVGFVGGGIHHSGGRGAGQALATGYHAWMLGRAARQVAATTAAPAAAGVAALATRRRDGIAARSAATSALARERLADRHRPALLADVQEARGTVAQRDRLRVELRAVDRRLAGYDENVAVARATGGKAPKATGEQRQLLEHRDHLRELLADPSAGDAEHLVRHADRNFALTGDAVTHTDLDVFRARRSAQAHDRPPDGWEPSRHDLHIAGIDPQRYRAADHEERQRLRERVERALGAERDLASAAAPADQPPASAELSAARRWLDDDELRARTAHERERLRAERRRRRAQQGRYRMR